ncbi:MAG: hypothetical protein QXZ28_00885 [Candidatus Methanomethylicaceae archaeon]
MRSDPYDLPEWERKYERELLPQRQWLANELGGGRTMSTVWLLLTLFWMVQEGVIEVNVLVCQDANRSFLITCATFDVIAMLIGVFLKWYWDRRLIWTYGLRLSIPLVIAFVLSSGLVAWNPIKDEALQACLESAEFSRYIWMSQVAAIPRGLVLGGVVTAALYFAVLLVVGFLKRR